MQFVRAFDRLAAFPRPLARRRGDAARLRWCAAAARAELASTPRPTISDGVVTVHFIDPNCAGPPARRTLRAPVGTSIVDLAKAEGIDIHAACGQKLQCATCHVILKKHFYEQLQPPGVRETDMLESAFTLTPTSRLGCQVRLTKELDGLEVTLPDSGAKGLVRMPLSQPRPQQLQKEWTAVPAVPRPSHLAGPGARGPSTAGGAAAPDPAAFEASLEGREALESMSRQMQDQRALAAQLENELRQLRSATSAKGVNPGESSAQRKTATAALGSNAGGSAQGSESSAEDDGGLEKIKAELQSTRIDAARMGRRVVFDDIVGLEKAKRTLHEAVIWPAIADPALFTGIRGTPRGLLLYGPPGCGKTMLARAAAGELADHAAFFHVRPGDVMSKFYGESQRRVQALEEMVQEAAPAVVFLDEVDSLLGNRDSNGLVEHHRATTNALLAWMDGFGTGNERVFFLGATNRAEAIDEAALRRFGDAVEVGAPSKEARLALLEQLAVEKAHRDGHTTALTGKELEAVASRTVGYSLADMARLVHRAFLAVLREVPGGVHVGLKPCDVPPVKAEHFDVAMEEAGSTSELKALFQKRAQARAQQ